MSKTVLYYHIYLTDDNGAWSTIFLEQMKCIEDSGLMKYLDHIELTCISPNDHRRNQFVYLCESYDVPIVLDFLDKEHNDYHVMTNLSNKNIPSENHTYQKIYHDCQTENINVFYCHSKGVTSYMRALNDCSKTGAEEFKKYYYWRQYLNWGGIKHWKTHVRALKHFDVSGVNFLERPSPHFSGAFWWSKSSWIRTLPHPIETDWFYEIKRNSNDGWFSSALATERYKDEHWIAFRKETKVFNIFDNVDNPSLTLMTADKYEYLK